MYTGRCTQDRCAPLIRQIHCALHKDANNTLREFDLTSVQLYLLFILQKQRGGRLPLKDLEREMGIAQSTTAGLVKRMEEKGLVACAADPADRRVKTVCVTEKGLRLCEDAKAKLDDTEQLLLRCLSEEERTVLLTLLKKVRASVCQSTDSEPEPGKETL